MHMENFYSKYSVSHVTENMLHSHTQALTQKFSITGHDVKNSQERKSKKKQSEEEKEE